jgi:hypothetical protein
MECKVCKKPIILSGPTGMAILQPLCKCGKLRKRIREAGCVSCGEHGLIQLELEPIYNDYYAYCPDCKHRWRVDLNDYGMS